MSTDLLISVVAIVENDAPFLHDFVEETCGILHANYAFYELLLVDNGSTDGSEAIIATLQQRLPNIRSMRLSRPQNHEACLSALLDHSIGDYVVLIDPKCDPPALISDMVAKSLGGYDVVVGECEEPRNALLFRWARRCYFSLATKLLHVPMTPESSYFRVLSRQVVNSLTSIRNRSRSFRYFNRLVGFKQEPFPYEQRYRAGAQRKREAFWQSVSDGIDIIISYSASPLQWASSLGFIASAISLLFSAYVIAAHIVKKKTPEGWMTSNLIVTTLFFMLFVILSILSRYVARIIDEVRDQPMYFIESESQSSVLTYKQALEQDGLNVV